MTIVKPLNVGSDSALNYLQIGAKILRDTDKAIDHLGDIASGVTTSGIYLKLPGRVGDSPIIGTGNYCNNKYGAATCTFG